MKKVSVLISMICVFLLSLCAYAAEPAVSYTMEDAANAPAANGGVTYVSGVKGNAAYLTNNAYLTLPSAPLVDASDFTVSMWVKPDKVSAWMRTFDFGTGTTKYMFFSLTNGANTVFAITTNGAGNEQKILAPMSFKTGEWTHVAVTKSGNIGIMYINGAEAGRNDNMTVSPSALGATTRNYIGKSQYNDPYLTGAVDELVIYKTALSPAEIAALATPAADKIASVNDVYVKTDIDVKPALPQTVTALLKDGSVCNVPVSWEEYDEGLITKGGSFTVNGSAGGFEVNANITVNGLIVTPSISAEGDTVTATYDVSNRSEIKEAILFMAVYDEGRLQRVSVNNIDDLKSGKYTISEDISDLEEGKVKVYMWSKELEPLCEAQKYENNTPTGSSFEVSEVKLTDGIFKTSQDLGKSYIMQLDVDKLLAPVAHSTGATDSTSNYYGGWEAYKYRSYTGTGISGHSLGHWLSAMSTMYAATGDSAVKEKLDYAIDKLDEYQKTDGTGYIGGVQKDSLVSKLKSGTVNASNFELNGYWVPWYSFHKIYQGLIDAYTLTGSEKALAVVKGFADWAIDVTSNLDDNQFAKMLTCEYGGMNDSMAQLYEITKEQKYLDLAERFSQKSVLEPLSNDIDSLEGMHANTQIPKIIGAAEIYEQDNNREDYVEAAKFFYDTVVNHRSYVIGGNSNREHFGSLTDEVLGPQTLETCNTHNMLKLTEHLYSWNHKAEYMDYYEKALFNHILASQDPETGEKTYFMATNQGHFKVYSDALNGHSFWCCVGSGMENPGRYTRNIYYKDGDNFFVNQFISSEVSWKEKNMTISQETNFPYSDTTTIKINSGSANAKMKIRIPAWVNGAAKIKVNDEAEISVTEKGYYTLDREWSEGDTVVVTLPMALNVYTARDDKHKVAYTYGPVVLAGELGTDTFPTADRVDDHTSLDSFTAINVPDIIVENKNPETFIELTNPEKLEFTLTNYDGSTIKLKPYSDLHHERYSLYWMMYLKGEEIEKDAFTEALDAATIDVVRPNEQQPEVDHNMQTNNSYSGYFSTVSRGWRDARGEGGYFSYDLKVDSAAEKNYAMALYWGSDAPFSVDGVSYTREFEILADGTVIGSETLNNNSKNNLIYKFYEIPSSVAEGKEKVTITFRAKGANKAAGGVFEVRTTTATVTK